jgi:glycosyltransferase involved in cell wall biosynthesis
MKVCLVAQVENWRGGIQQYSQNYAEALVDKTEVEVIGYRSYFPVWLYPGDTSNITEEFRAWKKDVPVHNILKYYSWLSVWMAFRIIKKKIKADVVDIQWATTFHTPILFPLMFLIKHFSHSKVLLTVHNVLPHERRFFDKSFCRWVYRLADGLVVHTQGMRQDLIDIFRTPSEKIYLSPHGTCLELPGHISKEQARRTLGVKEEKILFFFGLVRKYKGLEYLLRAFHRVKDDHDVGLLIAGDFVEDRDHYEALIDELNIRAKLYLHSRYIKDEEVPMFFAAADIVVQPYIHFKGQSGVVPTAYYYSLPVVATAVGGLSEIVREGETGILVEPGDAEQIVEAVRFLLEQPELALEYGRAGKRLLETELSWGGIVDRMLEVYRECIKRDAIYAD